MKYLLIILGVILLIPAVIWIMGMTLPQSHSISISQQFDASPEEIYMIITDIRSFPEWRSNVEQVEFLNENEEHPVWREGYSDEDPLSFRMIGKTQNQSITVEIADENLPFSGQWTYTIEPQKEGARLTITENGEVYNPIFRFVSAYIIGHDSTIKQYMSDLETELNN